MFLAFALHLGMLCEASEHLSARFFLESCRSRCVKCLLFISMVHVKYISRREIYIARREINIARREIYIARRAIYFLSTLDKFSSHVGYFMRDENGFFCRRKVDKNNLQIPTSSVGICRYIDVAACCDAGVTSNRRCYLLTVDDNLASTGLAVVKRVAHHINATIERHAAV